MDRKKGVILTLILAAMVGFIFFYEIPKQKEKGEKETTEKAILDIDWDQVDRIIMEKKDKKIIIEKEGEKWLIKMPFKDQADSYQVTSILNGIRFASVIKRIGSPDSPLSDYGLGDSKMKVTIRSEGASKTLEVGNKHKMGGALFIKLASEKQIMVVKEDFLGKVDLSFNAIRESKLLRNEIGPVLAFEFESKTNIIKGVKEVVESDKGEKSWEWKLVRPYAAQADEKAVDALIERVEGLIAADFVYESRDNDSAFDLDNPFVKITLTYEDKEEKEDAKAKTYTVLIGNRKKGTDFYFAALDHEKFVVTLHSDSVEPFFVSAASLRDRRVVKIKNEIVARIALQIAGTSTIITDSDSGWKLSNGKVADNSKSQAIIDGLLNMEGEFLEEGPKVRLKSHGIRRYSDWIALYDNKGKLLSKISPGKRNMKLGSVRVANITTKSPLVYKLAVEDLAFWPSSIDELANSVEKETVTSK